MSGMSGMVCLRNIQKSFSRLNWSSITKSQHACTAQKACRSISTSNIHNFKIVETNREKISTENRKYWVSTGFNDESEHYDKLFMHTTLFVTISICLVLGGYIMVYLPDFRNKDWAQREAYLELRRRESEGLPPISPNLIDPDKIVLPTDEELGDTEIII